MRKGMVISQTRGNRKMKSRASGQQTTSKKNQRRRPKNTRMFVFSVSWAILRPTDSEWLGSAKSDEHVKPGIISEHPAVRHWTLLCNHLVRFERGTHRGFLSTFACLPDIFKATLVSLNEFGRIRPFLKRLF